MKLLSLAAGRVHRVWAIVDEEGKCSVTAKLEELEKDHPTLQADMASLILQYVPEYGIPWHDRSRAGKLYGDEIFEFKACEYVNKRKTKGLRVAFFQDLSVVVCTHAFEKENGGTPPGAVPLARRLRTEYLMAKQAGTRELLED